MDFLYACDLFGVAVFACSGALMAGRKAMDWLGVLVIALVAALGGGTLRDVVLGHHPVSWVRDAWYIAVPSLAATAVILWERLPHALHRIPGSGLLIADALGLAIATVIGTEIALRQQAPASAAMVLGVMSGVAGGVMRDIICNEIPLVFQREIYATASLAGAAAFTALSALRLPGAIASSAAIILIFTVRLSAIRWQWALPRFQRLDSTP